RMAMAPVRPVQESLTAPPPFIMPGDIAGSTRAAICSIAGVLDPARCYCRTAVPALSLQCRQRRAYLRRSDTSPSKTTGQGSVPGDVRGHNTVGGRDHAPGVAVGRG